MNASLSGKTIVLTGATSGIGKAAALQLATMGARLVLVSRDPAKCARVTEEIEHQSGNQALDSIAGDLSVIAETRRVAAEIIKRCPRIDVLVNNAGMIVPERRLTADGYEHTFALNHLGYFTLTELLLDTIKASAPSRIVNVSSEAHRRATIDFNDVMNERAYGPMKAYGQSKLANVLFTYELARRLQGTGVTANCLHPGVVRTGFGSEFRGLAGFLFSIGKPFLISPTRGAETTVFLASSPGAASVSGKYFKRCRSILSNDESYRTDVAKRLWELSTALVQRAGTASS